MKHSHLTRSIVAGFALSMAAASTFAQPSTAPAQGTSSPPSADMYPGKYGQQRMGGHGHSANSGMSGMHGMGQLPASLVEKLSLSDKQKVALVDAQTAMSGMREARNSARQSHHDAMNKSVQSGTFDPRAMFEQQNKMREAMQANRDAVQKKWLVFWDSLSKEQQAQVSDYMRTQMSQRGKRSMGPRAG